MAPSRTDFSLSTPARKVGVAIFAHGSVIESANESVRAVAAQFASSAGLDLVEPCFLELGRPDLAEAVRRLVERGASRVVVVPYFLTLGKHMQRDLPRIVESAGSNHPGLEITVTPPLDGHPAMVEALLDRALEAVRKS
jgi:sirohydrochlorin ferrochelatase